MSGYTGVREPPDVLDQFLAHSFLIERMIDRLATTALVKVTGVTNAGAVTPVGFVDIQPMVNEVDGSGKPTQHSVIHNVPYFRLQGGTDAVILDPKVGDIGIAVFCSRDSSIAKRAKAVSNPGSARRYDWADALYIGGVLNGVPAQFVRFSADGVEVSSPTKVQLTAPVIEINAATELRLWAPTVGLSLASGAANAVNVTGNLTMTGNITQTGTITNNGHRIDSTHVHSGVQTGGGNTGTPL